MICFAACNIEVLVGFDVSAQNIFSAQPNLLSKMNGILQRISKMAAISCSSGQIPSVQVGILAMDSASEPAQLQFTNNADELFEAFRALRSRGPFVLNGKTISAYTNRFKGRQNNAIKVGYLQYKLISMFLLMLHHSFLQNGAIMQIGAYMVFWIWMHLSDISIGISPDIEGNSQSGVRGNVLLTCDK